MKKILFASLIASSLVSFSHSSLLAQDSKPVEISKTTAEVSAAGQIDPAKAVGDLKKLFQDLVADNASGKADKVKAALDGLKLSAHEKWFAETFGAEKAKGVAAEYGEMLPVFDKEFGKLLEKAAKGGESEILVYMITPGADLKEATGLQKDAIAAMARPCPLFTVKFVKPGEKSGISVWSLIQQDGSFRFVGKMKKIK